MKPDEEVLSPKEAVQLRGNQIAVAAHRASSGDSLASSTGYVNLEAALRCIESYMGPKLYCDGAYSEAAKAWEHLQKALKAERRDSHTGGDMARLTAQKNSEGKANAR